MLQEIAKYSGIRDDIYTLEAAESGKLEPYLTTRIASAQEALDGIGKKQIADYVRTRIEKLTALRDASEDDRKSHFDSVTEELTSRMQELLEDEEIKKELGLSPFELQNLQKTGKMTREARYKLRLYVEKWLRDKIGI